MNAWFEVAGGLLVFRRGPSDLPHAPRVLAVLVLLCVVLRYVAGSLQQGPTDDLVVAMSATVVELLLLQAIVHASGKSARFVQTASALLVVHLAGQALITLLIAPVAPLGPNPAEWRPEQSVMAAMSFPIAIWSIALSARILRDALECGLGRAVLLVLALSFTTLILASSIGIALA